MIPRAFWQLLAACYFAFQTLCVALWWTALALAPPLRALFRPLNTPDSALFSFFLPDAVFFLMCGIWATMCLVRNPAKARLPLALHVGASGYAALYCAAQTLLTGQAWLAAILMTVCALCGAFFAFKATSSEP